MSLGELLVIALVALFVLKPEDIPVILSKVKQFKLFCSNLKNQAISYIDPQNKKESQQLAANIEEINFYLGKILALQENYQGEYSLEQVKSKYQELVQKELNKQKELDK
ncbi:DUF2672 domain-containing protein [Candidatus Trichorickettsia mobilis]|uniref:DUF2672 domain-containing protein n=1 Tax=Candidatus Trichorickettsia mobilis TaxID=1346319 RepID=A0ABZ0UQA2_9RICK|nr:DUF2672 domain-containing protein [Candidatus Trichorickettsia mobilis]WPY00225.1 DUF2672 domain-containing protein [Candidatus Trichorickettsia mobilis]